jgi:alkylhydroperoxidase/carboxymuconolactone decarboxylase family protein YurZ
LAHDIAEIEPEIVNALDRITELAAGEDRDGAFAPKAIPLSPDALTAFEQFRQLAHDKKQALEAREREWMAKAQAHALRLAGTLELLHWCFIGGDEPKCISVKSIDAAARLVEEYFWPHSRAALRQIGLSEKHVNERRVLRWLAASSRSEFSREEIRVDCLGRSLDAERTQNLINALAKSGWCRKSPISGRE